MYVVRKDTQRSHLGRVRVEPQELNAKGSTQPVVHCRLWKIKFWGQPQSIGRSEDRAESYWRWRGSRMSFMVWKGRLPQFTAQPKELGRKRYPVGFVEVPCYVEERAMQNRPFLSELTEVLGLQNRFFQETT